MLSKRISKRAEKFSEKLITKTTESEPSIEPIFISKGKKTHLQNKLKSLYTSKDHLNEAWRLAKEEGDDRETDALTVSLKLLEENDIEINEVESILSRVEIINSTNTNETVEIGSSVTIKLISNDIIQKIMIVDPVEADPTEKKLSCESPIGKAILHKRKGEKASYTGPNKDKVDLVIIEIA